MAHFYKYNDFRGIKMRADPKGMRGFRLLCHFPYLVGARPKFRIKTITGKELWNNTFPVYEWFQDAPALRQVGNLGPFNTVGEVRIVDFDDCYYIPPSGALEYWINNPHDSGAWKMADFKGNWMDQIWLMIFSGLIGALCGLFIGIAGS